MREPHGIVAAHMGQRLKSLRGKLTQAEFADRLELSQAQYNRYETGKRLASDKVILRVSEVLGLDADHVVWGEKTPYQAEETSGSPDFVQAIADLVRLLDDESLEDLYYFLKSKTQDLSRRQRQVAKQAQSALEKKLKKAQGET